MQNHNIHTLWSSKKKTVNNHNELPPTLRERAYSGFKYLMGKPGEEPWGMIAIVGLGIIMTEMIRSLTDCLKQKTETKKSLQELRLAWFERNNNNNNKLPEINEDEERVYKLV